MRRVLLRLLGVAVFTWLEFVVFPGHTYLQAGTQITVPMIERLANPGFLSRDLVATYPNLQYTVYDEAALFLHDVSGAGFEKILLGEQIACRAAGILGILLLALSAGMTESLALLIAACVNLGATLAGPHAMVVELESVPSALAWGLVLLATGLIARGKPLLGGLMGGLGLVYDPAVAGPFWLTVIVALIGDRRLRRFLRPAVTVLAVFVLLLANLAQLQPGVVGQESASRKMSGAYAALLQFRTPYDWVSLWPQGAMWSYLALWVCGVWAVARIWPVLNRGARWFFIGLPVVGLVSVPVSYVLLDRLHWPFVPHLQPTRWLLFTVCLAGLAYWIAGIRAAQRRRSWESGLWFVMAFALPLRAEVLNLLRVTQVDNLERISAAAVLALVSTWVLVRVLNTRLQPIVLMIPTLATALLWLMNYKNRPEPVQKGMVEIAEWVKRNTWGSSMFLFPDLGQSYGPGFFRARSERCVWVDWNSGELAPYFESFAGTWWDRWQQTMEPRYSPQHLQADLALPVDYYVLTRDNRLAEVKPVFANEDFVVYDANDLRNATEPLRPAQSH